MKWMFNKQRGEGEIQAVFALFVLLCFVVYIGRGIYFSFYTQEMTARVIDADIKRISDDDTYLFNVQPVEKQADGSYKDVGDQETIKVADSTIHGQYRSADIYFKLKDNVGAVYHFKLQGWRSGWWSEFPNIYEYALLQDKGR